MSWSCGVLHIRNGFEKGSFWSPGIIAPFADRIQVRAIDIVFLVVNPLPGAVNFSIIGWTSIVGVGGVVSLGVEIQLFFENRSGPLKAGEYTPVTIINGCWAEILLGCSVGWVLAVTSIEEVRFCIRHKCLFHFTSCSRSWMPHCLGSGPFWSNLESFSRSLIRSFVLGWKHWVRNCQLPISLSTYFAKVSTWTF